MSSPPPPPSQGPPEGPRERRPYRRALPDVDEDTRLPGGFPSWLTVALIVCLVAATGHALGGLVPVRQAKGAQRYDLHLAKLPAATQLRFLNAQRLENGIPGDLTEVKAWSDGCAKHMAYLERNDLFQHEEDPGAHPDGYTPEGDAAGRHSVLTTAGSAFTTDGENEFEHAPLHLAQMLNPWTTRSGAADGCLSTIRDLNRRFGSAVTFQYPANGRSTFAREVAREEPFVPGDFVGLPQGTETGPHLYFFYAGPTGFFGSLGAIQSAEVVGPEGPVEVRTVDNHTREMGHRIPPGGIVIPVHPLEPGATYTATVRFQPDHAPVQLVSWTFHVNAQ